MEHPGYWSCSRDSANSTKRRLFHKLLSHLQLPNLPDLLINLRLYKSRKDPISHKPSLIPPKMGSITKEALLDETVWSNPYFIMQYGPLHDNTILMYFADSPWCEPTSNNKTIMNQALYNQALASIVATREAFEKRLKSMSGLEYMVEEAPAETGPGQGTGVWVIRKQMRKKRGPDHEDEVTVLAVYYVIGQNIYPAPSLMDMMSSKLVRICLYPTHVEPHRHVANPPRLYQATISHAIGNIFESANSIQKWTPARGHAYVTPTIPRAGTLEPKEATPMPEGSGSRTGQPSSSTTTSTKAELDARLAEESFTIHSAFGGDYMDEIPITGKPGDFHFASTRRNDKLAVPQPQPAPAKPPVLAPLNTAKAAEVSSPKDAKKTKSPKPGSARTKDRRKSKGGSGTVTGTPTPS